MKRLLVYLAILFCVALRADAQTTIVGGGGSSFNAAAPGAIGGTTSSTLQSTNIAIGASVPTLDGTAGDLTMSGGLAVGPSVAVDGTAGDVSISRSGGALGLINLGTGGSIDQILGGSSNIRLSPGGATRFALTGTAATFTNVSIQSTGGAIPTATCSGGSTGVVVAAGSTNNRGSITTSSSASTSCTITWSAAGTWGQAPFCVVSDGSASITPTAFAVGATGTATMVFDFASASSKVVNWVCM